MPKETPGTVCFVEINTTRKVEIMNSSIWFRPLASSSALLAGIGAFVVAAPITAQGNSIAKSVSSPAYALLSHDGAYDNQNDNENDNETDNENDDNYANGTHVEDDVYTNGTHVENDVYTNGTHVEDSTGTHVDDVNGTHVDDVYTAGTTGTHVEDSTGTHVDAVGTHVEISDGGNASVTSFATGLLTQNQTPAQPRVKWTVRGTAAGSLNSGSSTTSPTVSVSVTGTSAKPAKSAESESTSSATRTPGSVSAQNNETSTRSKVRTSRTSAAR